MDSQYRYIIDFLSSENIKESIKSGNIKDVAYHLLSLLMKVSNADYASITIWDIEKDIMYFHHSISQEDINLPPAKPGHGPMGICISKETPVYGMYPNFSGTIPTLRDVIGPIICMPVKTPIYHIKGAIGIGRMKNKPMFNPIEDTNIRITSNIVSAVMSICILQGLLEKERSVIDYIIKTISITIRKRDTYKKLNIVAQTIHKLFKSTSTSILKEFGKDVEVLASIGEDIHTEYINKILSDYSNKDIELINISRERNALLFRSNSCRDNYLILSISKNRFGKNDLYLLHLLKETINLILKIIEYEKEKEEEIREKTNKLGLEVLGMLAHKIAKDIDNTLEIITTKAEAGIKLSNNEEIRKLFKSISNYCRTGKAIIEKLTQPI